MFGLKPLEVLPLLAILALGMAYWFTRNTLDIPGPRRLARCGFIILISAAAFLSLIQQGPVQQATPLSKSEIEVDRPHGHHRTRLQKNSHHRVLSRV